ncbi:hypothetical protein V1507DRAFT_482972 [Lipomyces tetrasporus]
MRVLNNFGLVAAASHLFDRSQTATASFHIDLPHLIAGSSTNSRRSLSRSRVSTTTRNSRQRPGSHAPAGTSAIDVSSTTLVTLTTDMSLQKDKNAVSDYETALSLLEHNPPEQRLDDCWSKIRSARNISEDQKISCDLRFVSYPYLAYNTVAEIVTVVTVPRDLHEGPAVKLGSMILTGAQEYLSSHGAGASLIESIVNFGSTTLMGRYGGYAKSKKQGDGTIKYKRSGAQAKVMIAIEVGYSEHYTALCRDKDLWIEGQHVKVCILVCLDESPRFRNPDTRYEHDTNVDVEMDEMAQGVAESVERDSSQSYYAFIEVWRANKRQPTRYQLIQNIWSSNRLPKSIGLKMSDFVPDEDLEAANIPDGSLSFDGSLYVHLLRTFMETTAEERYQEFISP